MSDLRDKWARAVLRDQTISNGCARTAWAIREYANKNGQCTMGIARLAADTGFDSRTVERHIVKLVGCRYLKRTPGAGVTTRGGTTCLTELKCPAKDPTEGPVDAPPTARSVPPTGGSESTDQPVPKYRSHGRANHKNHRTKPEPASADGRAGATDKRTAADRRFDELHDQIRNGADGT